MCLHRFICGLLLLSCIIAGGASAVRAGGMGRITTATPDPFAPDVGSNTDLCVGSTAEKTVQDGNVRGGLDHLYRAMETRARAAAETNFTDVELAERVEFNVESESETRLVGSATYQVHLRGNIIGRNRFLVIVRVRGELTRSGDGYIPTVLGSSVLLKTKK